MATTTSQERAQAAAQAFSQEPPAVDHVAKLEQVVEQLHNRLLAVEDRLTELEAHTQLHRLKELNQAIAELWDENPKT